MESIIDSLGSAPSVQPSLIARAGGYVSKLVPNAALRSQCLVERTSHTTYEPSKIRAQMLGNESVSSVSFVYRSRLWAPGSGIFLRLQRGVS